MQIGVLHLSDIHIKTPNDAVLARARKIRDAFHSAAPMSSACVVLISGDIAFSGSQSEYELAYLFLDELRTEILNLPSITKVEFVVIPGNHDCNFRDESDIRQFLLRDIRALYDSGMKLDGEKARSLLSTQNNFFHFEAKISSDKELPIRSRISYGRFLTLGNYSVKLQCFNTAWLSRKDEEQSKLFLPADALEPFVGEASIVISLFHHPYNWLDANNYRSLRALVEHSSDFVFTGHEHEPGGSSVERFSGEQLHYIEGAALQGDGGDLDSGFNVILVNLASGEQKLEFFKWNGETYTSKNKKQWPTFIKNPARERRLLRINNDFYRSLTDCGPAWKHPRARSLSLRDIYVYPRLYNWRSPKDAVYENKKPEAIPSKDVIQHFRNNKTIFITGEDDSGKTSLLKSLYLDLGPDFFPLLIDASSLKGKFSEAHFSKIIREAVIEQYDESSVERFLQTDPALKVLLVDDFHKSNLSPKNEPLFLQFAGAMFSRIFITASDFYRLRDVIHADVEFLSNFQRCEIKPFGHLLRGALITKWLSLGRETASELESLDRDISITEKVITSLLGKNVVPSYPFSILTLLQMLGSAQSHSTAGTSYGHLYESLIKASLNFSGADGAQGADIKFTYISLIAFAMFEQERTSLTDPDLKQIHSAHKSMFHLSLDLQQTLRDLIEARVLEKLDGNYVFRYKHFYYYFVAKYFERAFKRSDGRSKILRQKLIYVADRLHNEEFANVILFYVHLTQDWELVRYILDNAARIYADTAPCDFVKDVEFVNRLIKEPPKVLVDNTNIDKNRDQYREEMDRVEENEADPGISLDAKVKYDDNLEDIHKVNIALKTLQVLGQVLRSSAGSLEGDQKLEITQACYMLGLRTLQAILKATESNIEALRYYLAALIRERAAVRYPEITPNQISQRTDEVVIELNVMLAFGLLKKISYAVGQHRLGETYDRILETFRDSTSINLVDLQIKLDHFAAMPEYDILRLRDKVGRNLFTYTVLSRMIADFLYLYKSDIRTVQKLGSLFEINSTAPAYLLPDLKIN